MGEAKRKAANKRMLAGMKEAQAEGQGVWSLEVYNRETIPQILFQAGRGDRRACELAEVVESIISEIHNPTLGKDEPSLCLTCDTAFTPTSQYPEAFVVISGANPDARQRIVSVLCKTCDEHPDARNRIIQKIRWGLIPDAREIQIGEAGNA